MPGFVLIIFIMCSTCALCVRWTRRCGWTRRIAGTVSSSFIPFPIAFALCLLGILSSVGCGIYEHHSNNKVVGLPEPGTRSLVTEKEGSYALYRAAAQDEETGSGAGNEQAIERSWI